MSERPCSDVDTPLPSTLGDMMRSGPPTWRAPWPAQVLAAGTHATLYEVPAIDIHCDLGNLSPNEDLPSSDSWTVTMTSSATLSRDCGRRILAC